jgi:uncharacterized protein
MPLSRRELLTRGAVGAGLVAIGDTSALFAARPAFAGPASFGAPIPDPAGMLDLPQGFSYSIVSRKGDPLSAGPGTTPGSHDGTAAFDVPGHDKGVRLVQNHEISTSSTTPTLADPSLTYDPKAKGGTTTLTLDGRNNRIDERVSLAGTWSNCAGGLTPWGTWLTCEETEQKAGASADKNHGFVFEVDPHTPGNNLNPTPLTALGRFAHEAVAIDPVRGHAYLTEDASSPNGLVYKLVPNDTTQEYGALRNGGALSAMRCSQNGVHIPDLSVFDVPGTRLRVTWVPVPDPQAATVSIRNQLTNAQVTRSRKFEGIWWGASKTDTEGSGADDRAHIVCSFARISDGSVAEHDGQVWAYDPNAQTLTLEVRFALNTDSSSDNPDGPDNITVTPHGGLMLAEDGNGVQHLVAIDREGDARVFARNRLDLAEFTGVCFSPDGKTMFTNFQDAGLCFAITGPFGKL